MAWTKKQRQAAAIAARQAGIPDEHRKLILRQLPASLVGGEPTSTARRLSQADFEQFMATLERSAGGQLAGRTRHHWRGKADDALQRMRHKARAMAAQLERAGVFDPGGAGLRGWIRARVAREHRTDQLDELEYDEVYNLIEGLKAFAGRRGVRV